MKKPAWVEKLTESSAARTLIFFVFAVLTGSFAFLAWRANADLTTARASPGNQAQQSQDLRAAGSLDDFYSRSWLADDRNLIELDGYVNQLLDLAASPSLNPAFKQKLNDYIKENRARLPEESAQLQRLSFSNGILRQHQSRLLEMYDQLDLVFQTMQEIVTGWELDAPQSRGEKMLSIQNAFATASLEFQTTTASHRQILDYARLLETQSKQDSARIRNDRAQLSRFLAGLSVSVLLFAGWIVLLFRHGHRKPGSYAP